MHTEGTGSGEGGRGTKRVTPEDDNNDNVNVDVPENMDDDLPMASSSGSAEPVSDPTSVSSSSLSAVLSRSMGKDGDLFIAGLRRLSEGQLGLHRDDLIFRRQICIDLLSISLEFSPNFNRSAFKPACLEHRA